VHRDRNGGGGARRGETVRTYSLLVASRLVACLSVRGSFTDFKRRHGASKIVSRRVGRHASACTRSAARAPPVLLSCGSPWHQCRVHLIVPVNIAERHADVHGWGLMLSHPSRRRTPASQPCSDVHTFVCCMHRQQAHSTVDRQWRLHPPCAP
jgi:hypothetical protein